MEQVDSGDVVCREPLAATKWVVVGLVQRLRKPIEVRVGEPAQRPRTWKTGEGRDGEPQAAQQSECSREREHPARTPPPAAVRAGAAGLEHVARPTSFDADR